MVRPKVTANRAERIITAAKELFARYGYERTSIDDIAKHLDIGKGSIYLDFRTKEDILFAVCESFAREISAILEEKSKVTSKPAMLTLREMLQQEVIMVHEKVTRDLHTPEALLHTSATMKSRFGEFHVRKRAIILKLLIRAAALGEIAQDKATEDVALAIMMATACLYPPYLNNYSENDSGFEREQLFSRANILIDLLISGLQK
jgi:AcrR family transcriptional regulator